MCRSPSNTVLSVSPPPTCVRRDGAAGYKDASRRQLASIGVVRFRDDDLRNAAMAGEPKPSLQMRRSRHTLSL